MWIEANKHRQVAMTTFPTRISHTKVFEEALQVVDSWPSYTVINMAHELLVGMEQINDLEQPRCEIQDYAIYFYWEGDQYTLTVSVHRQGVRFDGSHNTGAYVTGEFPGSSASNVSGLIGAAYSYVTARQ